MEEFLRFNNIHWSDKSVAEKLVIIEKRKADIDELVEKHEHSLHDIEKLFDEKKWLIRFGQGVTKRTRSEQGKHNNQLNELKASCIDLFPRHVDKTNSISILKSEYIQWLQEIITIISSK